VPGPALAVTYNGGDPALLERLLPLVDAVEVTPDAIARSDNGRVRLRHEIVEEFVGLSSSHRLVAHGVGLSIGSFDHWDETYIHLLDELLERLDVQWHSEHLAYASVAGENVGTMFSLPRTEEALDLLCERVAELQRRYALPFLLEHVINLLPDPPGEYAPAAFLNEIASRTGCGLLLDAYNLQCDAHNQGLDIEGFLNELDLTPVKELHLAGGSHDGGFQLDVHSRVTADSTLALGREIMARAPNLRMITYEYLKDAVGLLGHDAICAELIRIRRELFDG
jgi:uncharacterized protein